MNDLSNEESWFTGERLVPSCDTFAYDFEMNQEEAISESVQLLPEHCNIADADTTHLNDNPVYEIRSEGNVFTSEEQQLGAADGEAAKLVSDYRCRTQALLGEHHEERSGNDRSKETATNVQSCLGVHNDTLLLETDDGISDHVTRGAESSPFSFNAESKDNPQFGELSYATDDDPTVDKRFHEDQDDYLTRNHDPAEAPHDALDTPRNSVKPGPSNPDAEDVGKPAIKKRIDVMSLPVVENPLQKEGRHTVIRGRLPDANPYLIGAKNLGRKLVSRQFEGFRDITDEGDRRDMFEDDLRAFLQDIHSKNAKLPIIGGGNLDLYALMKEVLLLGGVENVVKKRAFRIVAQQLELPKSCTSAAYVLKGAYEKFLYFYETRLVFGTWPDNTKRRVDMKSLVIEHKQREKLANQSSQANGTRKRRRADQNNSTRPTARRRTVEMDPRILDMLSTISNDPAATHRYLKLLSSEKGDTFAVPDWAVEESADGSCLGIIDRINKMDEANRISTTGEVILLAMAECFRLPSPNGGPGTTTRSRDLGLAKAICLLPVNAAITRKAQACLFSLLVRATRLPGNAVLAANQSAHGLIDGIFSLVQVYQNGNVEKPPGRAIPFINVRNQVINRDAAAAYCGLRIIGNLTKEPRNRAALSEHHSMWNTILPLLKLASLNRDFAITILDIVQNMRKDAPSSIVDPLLIGLLPVIEAATMEEKPDYDVSTRGLTVLCRVVEVMDARSKHLGNVVSIVRRLLHNQISILNTAALAVVVHTLVDRFAGVISADEEFIAGLFVLLRDSRCTSVVAETLANLHRVHPLHEYASRAGMGVADAIEDPNQGGDVHATAGRGMDSYSLEFEV